jgi:diguanylate cyclase (GGDEF)-like protein
MARFGPAFNELSRIGTESQLSANALLWREGDPGDEVILLLEGLLDVMRDSPEGEPVVVRTLEPGSILGEIGAFDGLGRSAAVRASTHSRLLRVKRDAFRDLVRAQPQVLEELFWHQVALVRSLTEQVARSLKPSILDPRTRLYSDRFFLERLRQELDRARETGDEVTIVMLEVLGVDEYRELQGPREMDEALAKVAHMLRGAARKGDLIARMSSGRFAVLLFGATSEDGHKQAARLTEHVQKADFKGASALPGGGLGVAAAVVTFPGDATRLDTLLEAAESGIEKARAGYGAR